MKVVFIQPYYENIWESLGIAYIAAYCKKHFQGELSLSFFQSNFDDDVFIIQEASQADIVGFSCTTPTFGHGVRLSREIKKINPNVWSVFGGWHVTALQIKSLQAGIDQIVVGEGEKAFLDILNGLRERVVWGVKLSWNQLEWPDREIIQQNRTLDLCQQMMGKRVGSFQANRGCPFDCAFCSETIMTGKHHRKTNPIRTRSPRDICDEITVVRDTYHIDYFKFVDGTFDTSPEFVIAFCQEKMARKDLASLPWEILVHASLATEDMFAWLEKSQCYQCNIGVESGSNAILKDIRKGLNQDIIRRVFTWGKKYHIKRRSFFLLGMPNETENDIKITENLIDEIQPDVVGFTILCPYPGSDFYDHDRFKEIDWSTADEYSNNFWETQHFSNAQLKEKQTYLTNKYNNLLCYRQSVVEN